MATLYTLPAELLVRICELADRRDLWALVRTCTWLRRVGLGLYMARLGVSRAHAESGTLTLPAAHQALLIVLVGHIRPLQKLVAFRYLRWPAPTAVEFESLALAAVLAAVPSIPDVMVYNRHSNANAARTTREAVELLARMPAVTENLLLIVHGPWGALGALPAPENTTRGVILPALLWGVPLLAVVLAKNILIVLLWVWDALVGPPWPFEARLAHAYGPVEFTYWMRVQTLPARLTLVTLVDKEKPVLTIRPALKGLSASQLFAVMYALDIALHRHMQTVVVAPNAKVNYGDLDWLVRRHAGREAITLGPGSIRAASLPRAPTQNPAHRAGAAILNSPAAYVPYFLVPYAREIALAAPNGRFNAAEHDAALNAIAALPGAQPIHLSLALRPGKTVAGLPWTRLTTADAEAGAAYPRPTRVAALTLRAVGGPFRAVHLLDDTNAFTRWLTLFPGLRLLVFAPGAVELPAQKRAALEQKIRAACGDATAIMWKA
ncbi:hypothetical protein MIND_00198400 [Mycena indigotica]|uniref:F-box domain-containing protein n=1 Tax=Mycena indigotica TaxID=2126181 RepID=A0A8H6T7Y6_9AGAR|nr:uncharacterized protein MIND_00198400 [Mycena indigotica]KAF7311876.1 hypothetical protein MIND_00198400 [Mycena indigotica]